MSTKPIALINRELSWLEFNKRVLEEARDKSIPLLERLKFLAITASNLDEFFIVRVGSLQLLLESGNTRPDPSGMTPQEQLDAISKSTHQITADQYHCYLEDLEPALAEQGVRRIRPWKATDQQVEILENMFLDEIFPTYTPMAVHSPAQFPLIVASTLNMCVQLSPAADSEDNAPRFALIPFGNSRRRIITLPSDGGYAWIFLEDMIEMFIHRFFPGEEVVACAPFRISRNADLELREDQASDLLAEMEQILDQRKVSNAVRLEVSDRITRQTRNFLQECVGVSDKTFFALPGPLDLTAFFTLTNISGFDHLKYESWPAATSADIDSTDRLFNVIQEKDTLLYHPYESFDPVVQFINEAAEDPDVVAIKQTLYRSSRDSAIISALTRAAENGKMTTVIVELKARFDEQRNIEWARHLEQSGVQVIYGVKGLKTHAKICIVVRREPDGFRRYIHFGTGNYNETTARFYTDASLFTCNEDLGADAITFFNSVSGFSQPQTYRRIEAAPLTLRSKLLEMIDVERNRAQKGHKALIRAKLNSLADPEIIHRLYDASQDGVVVELIVRGICCLRPGLKGVSENIRVVSIIDRLLEHSRIFHFHHGGDDRVFISSADWMPRNLDRRVELLVPVLEHNCRERLLEVLDIALKDTAKSHELDSDGKYHRIQVPNDKTPLRSQEALYVAARKRSDEHRRSRPVMFEPHRAPRKQ